MQLRNKNGGFVGLLIILLVIVGGILFVFKSNKPVSETLSEGYNEVGKTQSAIDAAKEAKDLLENNSQKSAEQTTSPIEDKNIINNEKEKIMQATLHTSKGDITIQFSSNTPKTVENFIKLAKEGFYNETKFHRIIKGFMSQGGDPLSKDDSKSAYWGTGGPGYKFEDEIFSTNKNDKYTISMANSGPNTNGSQFFINAVNNNFLDTKHTVFGKVVSGMDVADSINNVKTDPSDRPLEPVILRSITLK